MRQLQQPGPTLSPRRLSAIGRARAELRLELAPGEDLINGTVASLARMAISQAAVTLLAGQLAELSYLTGQPDLSGRRVATYGPPTRLAGPVTLLGGNGILGWDQAGQALLHCHGIFTDSQGRLHGGHLPPGCCRVGPGRAVIMVGGLAGAGFAVMDDPETNFSIFHPQNVSEEEA